MAEIFNQSQNFNFIQKLKTWIFSLFFGSNSLLYCIIDCTYIQSSNIRNYNLLEMKEVIERHHMTLMNRDVT